MNYTLVGVIVIFIVTMNNGFKKGMVQEISGLISWIVTLFVMPLLVMLYTSVHQAQSKHVLVTILVLLTIAIVNAIIRVFLKPVKLAAKLPVVKLLDQSAGIVVGVAEGLLIVWMVYILNELVGFGEIGNIISADIASNPILSWLYECNYLLKLAEGI